MMHTRGTLTLVLLASVSTPQWGQLLAHRRWFGTSTPILRPSLELKNRHIPRRQPWPPQRCPRATATLHDLAAVHTCSYPPPWPTQYTHVDTGPPPPRPTFLAPEPDRLENSNQLKPSQPCVSAITDLYANVHIAIHPQLPTMTLTGGSSIVSRLSGMSLVELVTMLRHRAASNNRTQPCVAVDVSWLGCRWSKRAAGPVGQIISFASILCKEGVKVLLVADGTARSDVKRASVHREAQRRFKREAGKQAMSDLIHARSRLTNADYNGADERAALEGEVKALDQHVLKSSRSGVAIPPDFYDQLESALPRVQVGSRGGSVELVRAEHQADYAISAMAIAAKIDVVVGRASCPTASRHVPRKTF